MISPHSLVSMSVELFHCDRIFRRILRSHDEKEAKITSLKCNGTEKGLLLRELLEIIIDQSNEHGIRNSCLEIDKIDNREDDILTDFEELQFSDGK